MTELKILASASGRQLAYRYSEGAEPLIVFLGGFKSDMEGTKAIALEDWAIERGQAFLRFDYSGHGQSSGAFSEGTISDWFEDARAVIDACAEGEVVLVGSSMGGWISLLYARAFPTKIAGLVTIAAAPDFTEDGFWASFDAQTREKLQKEGVVEVPSDYDEPYTISLKLIEDGRDNLVLRSPLVCKFPIRMLQGTDDEAVSSETALRLLGHLEANDLRLSLVKGVDHRFSTPACLRQIAEALEDVIGLTIGQAGQAGMIR